ncbi:MAG: hypothetical protein IPJ01_10725 [Micavibrio sp.]|nr:hypothetical protein [Micavibrio sp.]
MKTYTAKFDRSKNEDVYVLLDGKILKTKILKTRITDQSDYIHNGIATSGFKIEYLIGGEPRKITEQSVVQSMNWIEESNVFATKEGLIAKID